MGLRGNTQSKLLLLVNAKHAYRDLVYTHNYVGLIQPLLIDNRVGSYLFGIQA